MKSRNKKAAFSIFGCCLAVFWSGYLAFGYPGIMGTYWQEIYHVGAAETGTVVTFMLFALAVSMFFSGRAHMKLGMRKCILIGTAFNILAMLILMNGTSIYAAYAWGFVTNLGCSFIYGPGLTTAQQWLPHRRGAASGIVNFVFGISAAVMAPVGSHLLEAVGYSKMNLIILLCAAATNLVGMAFAETPDKTKLTQEEREAHEALLAASAKTGKARTNGANADFTVSQALKTKEFWLIWVIWIFMGAAGISMVSLSKSYAISLGVSSIAVLTAFNVVNGGGRIIAGMLSDLIGGAWTGVIAFVITAAGYAALPYIHGLAGVAAVSACVGFGFGTLFTVTGPIASGLFGLKYFGLIYGLIFTAYGFIAGILGPALSGVVLDKTGGNYTVVFGYLAAFALIGAGLTAVLAKGASGKKRNISI